MSISSYTPPYFVDVDSEMVLVSRDQVNGSCGCFREGYWTFDKDGPIALDFLGPVAEAEKKLIPPEFSSGHGPDFDIHTLTYSFTLVAPNRIGKDGHVLSGTIRLKFALRNHQLAVLSQEFDR